MDGRKQNGSVDVGVEREVIELRICFLGTAADDWYYEKPNNGSEYRRRCAALIDDVLLIDPGPQVLDACKDFEKDPVNIKYIINTHKHRDHFCVDTIAELAETGAVFLELKKGDKLVVGKYTIYAYAGNHGTCQDTLHYIISDGEKTLFYGLDGAWLLYEEFCAIKEYTPDFAVFDATIGEAEGDFRVFEHNNLSMVLEMQKTLKPYIKQFCISHMALTLHADHKTLAEKMKQYDIITAYDGLEIEI